MHQSIQMQETDGWIFGEFIKLKRKKLNLECNIIRNMKEQKGNKKGSLQ